MLDILGILGGINDIISLMINIDNISRKDRAKYREDYDNHIKSLCEKAFVHCVKNEDIRRREFPRYYQSYLAKLNKDFFCNEEEIQDLDKIDEYVYNEFKYQVCKDDIGQKIINSSSIKMSNKKLSGIKDIIKTIEKKHDEFLKIYLNDRLCPIQMMSKFVRNYNIQGSKFVIANNKKVKDVLDLMKNSKTEKLYVLAISGMGKTRWVCECFKDIELNEKIYYCDDVDNPNFKSSLDKVINENKDNECLLVLDDCPYSIYQDTLRKIEQSKTKIRLIGLYNDLKDKPSIENNNVVVFNFDDLKDITNQIIDDKLSEYKDIPQNIKENKRRDLIKYAEGIPYMAVLLTDSLNDNLNFNDIITNNNINSRILRFTKDYSEDKKKVLETLALFQPLRYNGENKGEFRFVVNSQDITCLLATSDDKRFDLFKDVINDLVKHQILEKKSSWINIRPRPIAVILVSEWFNQCDEVRLKNIFNKLQLLYEDENTRYISNNLVDGLCRRLEYLQCSDSAKRLIFEILKEGGSFDSEDILFSNLGSQLIKSMAVVNPEIVINYICRTLNEQNINKLQDYRMERVKSNIVRTLEKLCFPKETFDQAILILGKIVLLGDGIDSNNDVEIFRQVFHVVLSGTQANLEQRFNIIKQLYNGGGESKKLVLLVLQSVFSYKGVVRFCGAEKFGFVELKENNPKWSEVHEYWKNCKDLMIEWMNNDKSIVDDIAFIVEHNVRELCQNRVGFEIVNELMDEIIKIRGPKWVDLVSTLKIMLSFDFKVESEYKEKIRNRVIELTQSDIVSLVIATHNDFINSRIKNRHNSNTQGIDEIEAEKRMYEPLVEKFITEKLYDNVNVVSSFIKEENQIPYFFIKMVMEKIQDKPAEIKIFLKHIGNYIVKQFNKDLYSSFTMTVCDSIKDEGLLEDFLLKLLDNRFYVLYISIKTRKEDENLSELQSIIKSLNKKNIDINKYISYYINRVEIQTVSQFKKLNQCLKDDFFNDYYQLIVPILNSCRFNRYKLWSKDETQDVRVTIKEVLVDYIKEADKYPYDIIDMIQQLLDVDNKDEKETEKFAKDINNAIIDRVNRKSLPILFEGEILYSALLPKYKKVIWDDLSRALVDENGAFWANTYNYLGDKDDGEGVLFIDNEENVKDLCRQNKQTDVPVRIAHMVPKYHKDENGNVDRFSDFILWMLDNIKEFKNPQDILLAIDCRISSFSCIGSVVPLYEDMKKCYEKVRDVNKYDQIVVDWAQKMIGNIQKNIKTEQSHEDYMGLSYN